jgi:hypothetical protein
VPFLILPYRTGREALYLSVSTKKSFLHSKSSQWRQKA